MDRLMQDLRYAFRQIRRSPGFSATVIVVLALGIGVNSALLTGVNALLARAAPGIGDPDGVVRVMAAYGGEGRRSNRVYAAQMSYPDFLAFAARTDLFDEFAAFADVSVPLSLGEGSRAARAFIVTNDYFSILRVRMALGSGFVAGNDSVPPPIPMAVVSHRFWERELNRATDVVGRTMTLAGVSFRIVGVAPERFNGDVVREAHDLWLPIGAYPLLFPDRATAFTKPDTAWLTGVARLRVGVSLPSVRRAASSIAAQLAGTKPPESAERNRAIVAPLDEPFAGNYSDDLTGPATAIGAITLLVLAIACANVSGLLLGRGIARRREIAVRLSLGAPRARIVRQLLTEGVVLALIASGAALLMVVWISRSLDAVLFDVPVDLTPDWSVVALTLGFTILTGILFGVVPALHASRSNVADALKDGSAGLDRHRSRVQSGFVVMQVALSLVLLVAAGTMTLLLRSGTRIDLGYDSSSRVIAATLDLGMRRYSDSRAAALLAELRERAAGMPGVESAAFTSALPLTYGSSARGYFNVSTPDGDSPQRSLERQRAAWLGESVATRVLVVDPEFFATMDIPVIRGRGLDRTDVPGAPPAVVVGQDFAERTWPGAEPLGKRVVLQQVRSARAPPRDTMFTVVGVVPSMDFYGSPEPDSRPPQLLFVSRHQRSDSVEMTLLVRSTTDGSPLMPLIRQEVRRLDPTLPITRLTTMDALRRERLAAFSIASLLTGGLGTLALLLACVGVYAIVAFAVAQRSREIGIRMALGAQQGQVIGLFFRDGMRLTTLGVAIGLVLGVTVVRVLQASWVGVNMASAAALLAISATMLGVAALATWLPARRAATVDPLLTLKAE